MSGSRKRCATTSGSYRHHLLPVLPRTTACRRSRSPRSTVIGQSQGPQKSARRSLRQLAEWHTCVGETHGRTRSKRELARERPPRRASVGYIDQQDDHSPRADSRGRSSSTSLIHRNPARGKRRRLKASKPTVRCGWTRAEHIEALLRRRERSSTQSRRGQGRPRSEGRTRLPACPAGDVRVRRPANLAELTALRWRDVDLAGQPDHGPRIQDRCGHTAQIDLLPALRDELTAYKAQAPDIDSRCDSSSLAHRAPE